MPLNKEQFMRARKAGFSLEEIKDFEDEPLTKDNFVTARKAGFSPEEISNINKPVTDKNIGEHIAEAYGKFQQLPGIKQGDIAVEEVSKFIEPTVPAGTSNLGLAARLPQQMAAEFIRGYKPSQLLPFLGGAKLLKPVAMPIAKKV